MSQNNLLVLLRHGESEWNCANKFTGWKDPPLTTQGIKEAEKAGNLLAEKNFKFDLAYTSALNRAQTTLEIILEKINQKDIKIIKDQALNERDYGELTGLNKDDARKKFGVDQVQIWRRSYDVAPPGGESLKMTAERVLPYWEKEILPNLLKGKKILISAHGNSMRALIMSLEGLTGEEIVSCELGTGVPVVYMLDKGGKVIQKEILVD